MSVQRKLSRMKQQWIVVSGNPITGLSFIGPFDNEDAAGDYGGGYCLEHWEVAELLPPEGDDETILR